MIEPRGIPLVALVALLALSATGCGATGRARIVHGDDARENLDGAMRKAGVLFAPLYDPHGEAVDGGGGARDGCLEDANGAVERALKQRYRLTQIAPSGNDDATSTWPKIPAYAREAPGGRYIIHVDEVHCRANAIEVKISVYEREEGRQLMRVEAQEWKSGPRAVREAGNRAAQELFRGLLGPLPRDRRLDARGRAPERSEVHLELLRWLQGLHCARSCAGTLSACASRFVAVTHDTTTP